MSRATIPVWAVVLLLVLGVLILALLLRMLAGKAPPLGPEPEP